MGSLVKEGIPVPIAPNLDPLPNTASVSSSVTSASLKRWKNDWGGEATRLEVGEAETEDDVAEEEMLAVIVGVVGISSEFSREFVEY